jgi:hypothetical protein
LEGDVQVPQYWRGAGNRLYRIRREQQRLEGSEGYLFTVRAYLVSDPEEAAAEASVALREEDLREMVRLNQQVPTPEQLYSEAFETVTARLGR